jgi:acyl dehydratase
MALIIAGVGGLQERVGTDLGVSAWHDVPQPDVNTFARVTRDEYWLHTDPERARSSPFGGTIVHGLMTLGLGPGFSYEIYTVTGFEVGVNYGYGKVRFPAPVPVGSRLRMRASLSAVEVVRGGVQTVVVQTFECQDGERPVCVAESLARYLGPTA